MFLTEIGKCDFLTEMYYYKNNKSRSLCQANTNKKESQISLELFCGAYGNLISACILNLTSFLKSVAQTGSAFSYLFLAFEVEC